MRRLLKTLTLAGLAYAAWELIKRSMAEQGQGGAASQPPPSRPAASKPSAPSKPASAPKPAASSGSNGGTSKAELYERAQELGIKGRSKMSKAELERAIREAS